MEHCHAARLRTPLHPGAGREAARDRSAAPVLVLAAHGSPAVGDRHGSSGFRIIDKLEQLAAIDASRIYSVGAVSPADPAEWDFRRALLSGESSRRALGAYQSLTALLRARGEGWRQP